MENIFSKPHIYLAILWLAFKILLFNLFPGKDLFMVGAAINMFFLFLIIVVNIKKTISNSSFLIQIKILLQPAVIYSVLVGIAIFIYYSQVDPGFIQAKIDLSREALPKAIEEIGGFDAYKLKYPHIKEKSLEEFLNVQNELSPSLLSSKGQALFSVIGLLLLSSIMSVMFLLVSRYTSKRS